MENIYNKYSQILFGLLDIPEKLLKELYGINDKLQANIETSDIDNVVFFRKISNEIEKIVTNSFIEENQDFSSLFSDSLKDVYAHTDTFQKSIIKNQVKERFYSQPGDGFLKKIIKKFKLLIQKTIWLPTVIFNQFRKLRKIEPKDLNFRTHNIRKNNIADLVFIICFQKQIQPVLVRTLSLRQNILIALKEAEEIIEKKILIQQNVDAELLAKKLGDIQHTIIESKEKLESDFKTIRQKLEKQFEDICSKFGTFEFPEIKAKRKRIERKAKNLLKKQATVYLKYYRATYGLFEHWRLKFRIRKLLFTTKQSFYTHGESFKEKIEAIQLSYSDISKSVSNVIDDLQKDDCLINNIQDEIIYKKILKRKIPDFIDLIMDSELTYSYDLIASDHKKAYSELELKCRLPIIPNYKLPLDANMLKTVNAEYTVLESLEKYIEYKVSKKKNLQVRDIQQVINRINEIVHTIDYSLEYHKDSDETSEDLKFKEFIEGLKRASLKIDENYKRTDEIKTGVIVVLNDISNEFCTDIIDSTSLESLYRTEKLLIRKRKINSYKEKIEKFKKKALRFFKNTFSSGKVIYNNIKKKYFSLKVTLGINQTEETISSELANYLSDTETAIKNLPLMYQKLFAVKPLSSERFYVATHEIINKLKKAYRNWMDAKYAVTCLIGESGSGMTTTINYFAKNITINYQEDIYDIPQTLISKKEFIAFLKTIFSNYKFETLEQLIDAINERVYRRIIILENIQQLFLRVTGGFGNLNRLFYLISSTNKNIFWITTCNLYSWEFIDYSTKASDYFRYFVFMNKTDKPEIIKKIVDKRHNPSGFNLVFREPDSFRVTRKYRKMNIEEKQQTLKIDFYKRLSSFSQRNIGLALTFWQRSVIEVKDDIFYIKYTKIDHSFLSVFDIQKIKTLHNILIHGKLSIEEHSIIFDIDKNDSALQLSSLMHDAVIVEKENYFKINPLLYRQVVNHLKLANFIY